MKFKRRKQIRKRNRKTSKNYNLYGKLISFVFSLSWISWTHRNKFKWINRSNTNKQTNQKKSHSQMLDKVNFRCFFSLVFFLFCSLIDMENCDMHNWALTFFRLIGCRLILIYNERRVLLFRNAHIIASVILFHDVSWARIQ